MKITVTPHDINWGVRQDCTECPVALALGSAINQYVSVGPNAIMIFNEDGSFRCYKPSRSVSRFIKRFDDDKDVQPFSFIIKLENPVASILDLEK